ISRIPDGKNGPGTPECACGPEVPEDETASAPSEVVGPCGSRGRLLRRRKARPSTGLRARQCDGGVASDWYRAGGDAAVRLPRVARDLRGGIPRERHDGRVGLDIAGY